ncbi:hypothetical protein ACIO52_04605 [Nocardia sp. NPDC087230]|uniref:hypothetical protein n=1 Tax=Nocardia sp. NPDC087230 TaxID=3364331 RepID=UPI0038129A4E
MNLAGGADGWENKVGASKSQPLGDITEDFAPRHGLEDVIALSYGAACRRCDGDLACVCQLCAAETAS